MRSFFSATIVEEGLLSSRTHGLGLQVRSRAFSPLRSFNIVTFTSLFLYYRRVILLVLELGPYGSAHDLIKNNGALPEGWYTSR